MQIQFSFVFSFYLGGARTPKAAKGIPSAEQLYFNINDVNRFDVPRQYSSNRNILQPRVGPRFRTATFRKVFVRRKEQRRTTAIAKNSVTLGSLSGVPLDR